MFTQRCREAWLQLTLSPALQVGHWGQSKGPCAGWGMAAWRDGDVLGCCSEGRGIRFGYRFLALFYCPFLTLCGRSDVEGWRHPLSFSTCRAEQQLSAPLKIVILDKRLCNNLRNVWEDLVLILYKPSLTSGSLKSNLAELTRAANVEPLDSGERQRRCGALKLSGASAAWGGEQSQQHLAVLNCPPEASSVFVFFFNNATWRVGSVSECMWKCTRDPTSVSHVLCRDFSCLSGRITQESLQCNLCSLGFRKAGDVGWAGPSLPQMWFRCVVTSGKWIFRAAEVRNLGSVWMFESHSNNHL